MSHKPQRARRAKSPSHVVRARQQGCAASSLHACEGPATTDLQPSVTRRLAPRLIAAGWAPETAHAVDRVFGPHYPEMTRLAQEHAAGRLDWRAVELRIAEMVLGETP